MSTREQRTFGTRRRLAALLVLASATAAMGCTDEVWGPQRTSLRHYGFERSCAGELCGFEVTRGSAQRVDAFVAGEHALELSTTSRMAVGISLTTPSTWEGARLIARCEAGTSLVVEQRAFVWQRTAEGTTTYALADVTQTQRVRPGVDWDAFDLRFDPRAAHEFTQRVEFSIATEGSGTCRVDEIDYATYDVSFRTRLAQ